MTSSHASTTGRPAGLLGAARRRLGESLRARVAGPDADAAHARIWDTPGPRWFTSDDPIWRVHADASMFPGGIAALLLQSLHPLAMAGVAGHSGYRSDPWGRLVRTSHYLATTTYGTIEAATQAIEQVQAIHERVRGRAPDGRAYAASDPDLLRWVHVAQVWAFLTAHDYYGAGRLAAADRDRYVAQCAGSAEALGAHDVPHSTSELGAALLAYRPHLAATEAALDAAHFLLREPPLPGPQRLGYGLLARGAVAILPSWARAELHLAMPKAGMRIGALGTRAVRWGMSALN